MSKRLGPFAQGKPENPYEDRDAPGETPQRATAAQMAARKIKSAKPMRRGANSGLSQPSSSFGGPSGQPSFGFGASAPAPGGNGASNPFASINQQPAQSAGPFGGSASTSFPPAQSSAPSNAFSSSSFPAFGGNNSNGGSGFNPQPPSSTDFNFSASSSNPFGNPTANGGSSTAFSGSIFNFGGAQSQNANNTAAPNNTPFTSTAPQSNPFGGFNTGSNTNTSNSMFGQSTAASSNPFGGLGASNKPNDTSSTSNMFGASAPATTSSSSMFGNISATSNSASPAISSAPNPFAGLNSTAQNGTTTTSAPAGGNLFGTTAPSSNSIFSSGSNPFAKIPTPDTATTAAPSNLFNNTTTSTQPPNNPFAGVLSGTPSAAPSPSLFSATPAAPSNPFGGLSTSTSTEQSSSLFKPAQSTPKPEAPSTTPAAFNFGASLAKEPSKPAETPKPSGSSLFSGFGSSATPAKAQASNDKADTPKQPFSFMSTPKPADSGVSAPESASAPKANPFSGIATSTTLEKEKSLAQSTPSFGMFAKQTPAASPALPAFQPQAASSFTPFSQSPMPEKTQPPATTPAPAAAPPTATETTQESVKAKTANLPDVPKAHVPQQWKQFSAAPSSSNASGDDVNKKLVDLSAELGTLNERYRQKIISLPPMADWTALSKWHFQQSSEIAKKVIAIKKQRAAAMGITGNESVLSTKRKGSDDAPTESAYGTPSKKARPAGPSTSSVNGGLFSQPSASAPAAKDLSQTSGLFGSVLGKPSSSAPVSTPEKPSTLFSSSIFAKKPSADNNATPKAPAFGSTTPKGDAPKSGFQVPAFGSAASGGEKSQGGFQVPAFGSAASGGEKSQGGFQVPSFGSSSGGSKSFAAQFAGSAKTLKQLTRERKEKAMPEEFDFDTDDSDVEEEVKTRKKEWSLQWDRDDAARIEKEKQGLKTAASFTATTDAGTTSKSPFTISKPATGASSVFSSRVASPTPSASGSVFDAPSAAPSPGANIFGHLSSGPSSNNQDDSDDEEEHAAQTNGSQAEEESDVGDSTVSTPRRNPFGSESESEESLEETMARKRQAGTPKPSLLSRMTNIDGSQVTSTDINARVEAADADGSTTPKANGVSTPQPRFGYFDFQQAGAQTAPKPSTFGGDQTFKPGDQIKFSSSTNTKAAVPSFTFQSASPTPAEPANKPSNPFAFLSASAGQSAPASVTSSVFSSRAVTPSSDATDNEQDEDGNKGPTHDLSDLTEEERSAHDVLFHTDSTIAKHVVEKGEDEKTKTKEWKNCGRGQLWILKNKETQKAIVRIRNKNGNVDVNYYILASISAKTVGGSGKQVCAVRTGEDAKIEQIFFALRTPEIAEEFVSVYNKQT